MIDAALKSRLARAAEICRQHGITQGQIAGALGASQSQVSRILAGKPLRQSRLAEEVCLYLERFDRGVTLQAVRSNEDLIGAVQAAWDGSASHARALSTVIRSLSALRAPGSPPDRRGRRNRQQ
jgi:transcriptional regulator with XRE-family HTH domain